MKLDDDANHCKSRIEEEERLVRNAPSTEAGEIHQQLIMLYRAQLAVIQRRSGRM